LVEVIGVKFKKTGKIYYFDPDGVQYALGDQVMVETSRGIEISTVQMENHEVEDSAIVQPLRKAMRKATKEDLELIERNRIRAKEAFAICEKKIAQHGLEMKLIDAEYAFDGTKLLFYFTADGRVDFRELVKDLASVFRMRIELRQIGVRDEAKLYGGIGVCGRPLCCAQFLGDFHPVSIKMAKEQGLSLNPTKMSGNCSRLMCCLKYEQEAYEDLLKKTPKIDSVVETPAGVGRISEIYLLKQRCKVTFDRPGEMPKVFPLSECRVIRASNKEMPTISIPD